MNKFTLPPHRELPPDVHERMRRRVQEFVNAGPEPIPHRRAIPIAVAAAVAVLAAGVLMFIQFLHNHRNVGPATDPDATSRAAPQPRGAWPLEVDQARVAANMLRCHDAVTKTGESAQFPPFAEWTALFSTPLNGVVVTAIRAGAKTFLCETTPVSVTISNPGAPATPSSSRQAGILLRTPNGTIAGVTDPAWPYLELTVGGQPIGANGIYYRDGFFVVISAFPSSDGDTITPLDIDLHPGPPEARKTPLPHPVPPLVSIVDVAGNDAADRTSARGTLLAQCLATPFRAPIDANTWWPGALVQDGEHFLLVVRNSNSVGTCSTAPGYMSDQFHPYIRAMAVFTGPNIAPPVRLPVDKPYQLMTTCCMTQDPTTKVVAGVVPDEVARVELYSPTGAKVDAQVVDGTFAARPPAGSTGRGDLTCKAFDAKGKVVYEGALKFA